MLIDLLDDFVKDKENLREAFEKYEKKIVELSVQVAKHTSEEAKLKEDLANYDKEIIKLSVQAAEHQGTYKTLSHENNHLNKRLDEIIKQNCKGKSEGSRILEEELTETKANMTALLEKNLVLERELVRARTELEKSLK